MTRRLQGLPQNHEVSRQTRHLVTLAAMADLAT
jgi:hypothetical protein